MIEIFLNISKTENKLKLTWEPIEGANFYKLYRDITPMFIPDSSNLILSSNDTSYEDIDSDITNNIIGDIENNYYYLAPRSNDPVMISEIDYVSDLDNEKEENIKTSGIFGKEILYIKNANDLSRIQAIVNILEKTEKNHTRVIIQAGNKMLSKEFLLKFLCQAPFIYYINESTNHSLLHEILKKEQNMPF